MTTRDKCKQLRIELDTALKAIGEKLGMTIQVGRSMSFTDSAINIKLVASLPNATTGVIEPVEAKDFKANTWKWGLEASDLGRTFTHAGDTFEITGAKPKASKFPILAKRGDGKGYKFPADLIRLKLHPAA
jgi:hypothetical protein